jgi:2-polyprenyl-6-methoxyphenol hydroxylase-like FAD-dependent oxidoreductase
MSTHDGDHRIPGTRDADVLVVGAGPTGLLLAGELERRGVSCLLIDAHDAPLSWDRATVVHPRSMEIFEALGLEDRFLDAGVKVKASRFSSGGRTLGVLSLDSIESRYPFDIGLSEEVTESVLAANLERHGGEVTRSTRLVELSADSDGVVAGLERLGEQREVKTAWVVGCDGFHSTVRELSGIGFPGADIEARWAVFDAALEGWNADFDVAAAHLDERPVILTPLPGRRWRVYLRPSSESSDLETDALEILDRYCPGVGLAEVENPARFRCHSRVAERFRNDRILLAGDAAHACSPAEGHGMNTGLQDAFNLGWKLALVCRGECHPALLDSYEIERRPVAQRVVDSGAAAEAGQAFVAAADRAARDEEIARIYADSQTAHHEAAAAAELDRSYAGSPIVIGDRNGSAEPGRLLPETDPIRPADDQPCALHELTHRPGHTVFVIGGQKASPADVLELLDGTEASCAGSPLIGAVLGLATGLESERLGKLEPATADQLEIEGTSVLAVRPDRFVGFRHDGGDPRAIEDYLGALGA